MKLRHPLRWLFGLPLGRLFLATGTLMAVLLLAGSALITAALGNSRQARSQVLDVIDPAILYTMDLSDAQGDQQTAVALYRADERPDRLAAYREAVAAEGAATAQISRLMTGHERVRPVTDALTRLSDASARWRREYADVVAAGTPANEEADKAGRAAVQGGQAVLRERLAVLHREGSAEMTRRVSRFYLSLAIWVTLLVVSLTALVLVLRRAVLRPVTELNRQVGLVAAGDFDHRVQVRGPAELTALSAHVDDMRERILSEWRATAEAQRRLEDQATELRRSNGELEQFAYVASHDLQEPLRKVASFTQMLEQRYADQLDDRARQYIGYAVDGAKRMQKLINDLLDFSRVGRVGGERVPTGSGDALRAALRDLAAPIEESGARIEYGELPQVRGNPLLLSRLWQNVVSNAVKFRSADPPLIRIEAVRDGDMWEFSCSDNGIGIDPRYTDRIFLIFQRLHSRDAYPGTGIGLAMAKKIVEYLGGRIWVEHPASGTPGTTFRWTLPATAPDGPGRPRPGESE
ncbi:ATP-binding protein [Spongiactinospora sp. TRM90649]|uniref:sensor histidine kinase n=1 Tax=Spongiactinospora sp. TRM90649 TaxID=3031114 RepID=UPI0023F67528|nr:ATP-binding protein [Spongiactinospora sp. TRM90649]MDF5754682.1 ATP-binding protein [Spongiactinospora sp. TRM90649]